MLEETKGRCRSTLFWKVDKEKLDVTTCLSLFFPQVDFKIQAFFLLATPNFTFNKIIIPVV
jgi:hypothetical protein